MSEYQYFEFMAIDRPLDEKEMRKLRSYSTRARITPTSFVNHYHWGDFKGDEDAWMEKYFDAFLYVANWGIHTLKLRLPSKLLPPDLAHQYCRSDSFFVWEEKGQVIITFESDEEDGDWEEGDGWLSLLAPIRAELSRGDMRSLYLGWLLCVQARELDDDLIEPPVPPNLGELSAPLRSLADFLCIDEDLLAVAAEASPIIKIEPRPREEIATWIAALPASEKDEILIRLMGGEDAHLGNELVSRFKRERRGSKHGGVGVHHPRRRTVAELLNSAERHAEERRRIAAKKAAEAKARRKREAAIAREKHLDSLAGTEPKLWDQVERLVATRQPKSYDLAVALLLDLRDLEARKAGENDFRVRIEALRKTHARKTTFIARLCKVEL